ncbi:MAG: minichromosome maintenance protein MCM, partial [Vicinamibacteria bacterium]
MQEYTPGELVQKWEEFFDAFDYAGRILSVADAYPETRTLEVLFDEMNRFDTDFAIHFLHRPENSLAAGEEAIARVAPPGDEPIKAHLRIRGLPRDLRILVRDLRAEHLGRYVSIEGLVRKATEVRPKVVDATFQCLRCNVIIKEPQEGQMFREPLECYKDQGGCERTAASTKFKLLGEASQYLDTQKIEAQEPPEILRGGEEPQRIEAYMEDDIAGTITPGERIVMNGILRSAQRGRAGARSTIFDIFVEVNSVEKERVEFEEIEITLSDIERIREEAARPGVLDRVVQSIAPAIYGLEREKEALALQLFGGVAKVLPDGTRIRGDSHI